MGGQSIPIQSLHHAKEGYAIWWFNIVIRLTISQVGSEAEVRLQLRKDELDEVRAGKAPLHEMSATSFLVAGLQLEEIQYIFLSKLHYQHLTQV